MFVLSTLGLWEAVHRYLKIIDVSFVPGITVAIQTTLLFFAGLWNVLSEVTFIIYGLGFINLTLIIWKDRSLCFLRKYLNIPFLFLGISLIVMGFFLKDKIFTDYDNFSHWALVVRRIVETDRFPNFTDSIIMFSEYPLGSASLLYFSSKLIDNKEWIQMLTQIYMIIVSIIPLFSLSKKNISIILLLIASFTNYILVYNIAVTDLRVDTLLPLVSMSGLLFVLQYCKKPLQQREILPIAFYLIQIVQIKNSGLFFAGFISIILMVYAIKGKCKVTHVATIAMPYIAFFLWHKHCQYVFNASELSKHAMTSDNYTKVFEAKSSEDIVFIRNSLIKWISNWTDIYLTIGILLVVIFLVYFLYREGFQKALYITLIAVLLFVTYQAGMYGMYLYSMPGGEATSLAGIVRYEKTIIISMLYLSLVPIIGIVSADHSSKRIKSIITTITMIIAIFVHMWICNGGIVFAAAELKATPVEERNWVETVKQEYDLPNGESYTMLIPKSDSGYAYYLCKYIFQSNFVGTKIIQSEEDMDSIETKYILIYDYNNTVAQQWIINHFPDQADKPVIITR